MALACCVAGGATGGRCSACQRSQRNSAEKKNDEQDQTLGIHEPVRSKKALESCSRNRVVPARMIRMTPSDAAGRQPRALRRAVALDGASRA